MSTTPNDMSRIVGALSRLEGSSDEYDGDVKLAARTVIRRSLRFVMGTINANGNNAVLANAGPQERMIANGRVLGAYFIPTANSTAAATNLAIVSVGKLSTSTGVTVANVATQTTNTSANGGTGNLVLGVVTPLTVAPNIANARFTKGQVLGASVIMEGSGLAVAGTIQVDVELEGAATDYNL